MARFTAHHIVVIFGANEDPERESGPEEDPTFPLPRPESDDD